MLGNLFYSLLKSWKLKKLLNKYRDVSPVSNADAIIYDIYNFCLSDKRLRKIIIYSKASIDDFSIIYYALLASGAGQWSRDGHFVPISAFAFEAPLSYLLANAESAHTQKTAIDMLEYFGVDI
ncbi:MAG: hypothetical protein H6Q72_907 [Firmicutes bacterium]|nr:hypothetical protein [Bacillota bacterium]